MNEDRSDELSKRVEFKAQDDTRQIATGVVMVPDKVDLQGDFIRESVIRDFSEGFMAGLTNGDEDVAGGGVMHAVWPEEHVSLAENVVLDEARTIGNEDVPAGSWVQSWKFEDGELWSLVRDGILAGYSIGATQIEWSDPMEQDNLPDGVTVADGLPEDHPAWEIQDGKIGEVSSVDIPAVPDAEILALKGADAEKFQELIGDKEQFVEAMLERGHSQGDAERLWNYLRRAVDSQEVDIEASAGFFERAKRRLFGNDHVAEKESRTLSDANVRRLMAAHDSVEQALASELDFNTNRFTDNPSVDFDVESFDGKAAEMQTETEDKNMADESEDPPEWAKSVIEQTEKNAERIEELMGEGEKAEEEAEAGKAEAEPPEWAKALVEQTKENAESIETLAEASGQSKQLGGQAEAEKDIDRKYDSNWDKTFGLPTAANGGAD